MNDLKRKRTSPISSGETFHLLDQGINVLEGLVLHQNVISNAFETELIQFVQNQCERGRRGELKKPTYLRASGARSQGNEREAICYGGFFDFNRARPGKRGMVPPFPPILERLTDLLISSGYLPEEVRPDSCIINQYAVGDCIPPHVDHASYYRPISTLSLLGEEPMLVGSRFRTIKSCVWAPFGNLGMSVSLPRKSLLILGGNSGNVAKHCVSACTGPRISITLRKQPHKDWKPDESELVGKGGKRSGDVVARNQQRNPNEQTSSRKGKSLSGSAKRRKKNAKRMEQNDGGQDFSSGGRNTNASGTNGGRNSGMNSKTTTVVQNNLNNLSKKERKEKQALEKRKKAEAKQARRNARRLAKKKQELSDE